MIGREDLERLFDELGIGPGSVVLLQADLSQIDGFIGGETQLIETLCRKITAKGCLIVPTFTMQALDPACFGAKGTIEQWQQIRENHPGYSSRTMPADRYVKTASALLLHTKTKRSEHPVYSFAWLGPSYATPSLEDYNYPVSFRHILEKMKSPKAVNLLIGVNINDALVIECMGHERGLDQTRCAYAFVRRVQKVFSQPFLYGLTGKAGRMQLMASLDIKERKLGGVPVYSLMQKADS
jgi:aminoglycoside 3-N-acetyltransferase